MVNVLGILLGLRAATSDLRLIYVAALAALGAESISMGAVAYTSTLARRKQYLKEVARERAGMRQSPQEEREDVRRIFKGWGYRGEELEAATDFIAKNPRAWLDIMMSHELHLAPVEPSEPLRSAPVVFGATVFGSIVPLVSYLIAGGNILAGALGSVGISGAFLFLVGHYEAKTTVGSIWMSGLQMLVIGLAAGIAGFLIGHFIGAAPA